MTISMQQAVELICLVYHEARRVKHSAEKVLIVDHLSQYPQTAWSQLREIRNEAAQCRTAIDAAALFTGRLGVDLNQLVQLFENTALWKSKSGGKRWAAICSKVRELVQEMTSGDERRVKEVYHEILVMRHNTGTVEEKLCKLRSP